jgi:cytochrome P450 PksS
MGLLSFLSGIRRSSALTINLASPQFKAHPYDYYAKLRSEAPFFRTTLPTGEPGWLISRYDDAVGVLKDERFVKDRANALTPAERAREPWFRRLFRSLGHQMLSRDPPDHTRLRALVSQAFTPRLVEQMRDRIQALANELLDPVQARGRLDLIHDFALPLPSIVIAEMLGVPAADRHAFHRWSNALLGAAQTKRHLFYAVPNVLQFMRYLRRLIAKRRAEPRDDLVTALIQAEEAGDRLNPEELKAMIMLLLVAGHETTVNLIGNGMLALMQHSDQLEKLRANPGLIRPAVEELLRFTCPVDFATDRLAREDVSIGGVTIPRGELVFVVLTSANRDERQFPNPDKLDITREPNKHLSFGLGPHFCLGAPLARLEGQLAITTLLRRLPNLRLTVPPSELRWRRGLLLRGLKALPVEFGGDDQKNEHSQAISFEKPAGAALGDLGRAG